MELPVFLTILTFITSIAGQKISATSNGENRTIYVYFSEDGTSHQLTCLPDWQHPNPEGAMSWDFTNAPMAVNGVDFVGSNGSVANGILWLSFIRINSNITGAYACITSTPNGTSYTNFQVYFDDGSLSTGVLVGIVLVSVVLSVGAIFGAIVAAKRFGYISM